MYKKLILLHQFSVPVPIVKILKDGSQPDSPVRFRRDESRTFEASFSLAKNLNHDDEISFNWTIIKASFPPLRISDEEELFLPDTRELIVGRNRLKLGLKLVVFEVQIAGISLFSRDFIFLKVEESAIVAKIAGGTAVVRSIQKPLVLDGTPSYDPEDEQRTRPFIYLWSCLQEQHNARDLNISDGNIIDLINGSLRNALAGSTNSTSRLSRQTSDSNILNLANVSLNETRNESSRLLSKLTNFTGRSLSQLPDTVFKPHPLHGKVFLDTTKLVSNNTYYVVLKVRKDVRTAEYMQSLHIREWELIDIEIR